MRLLVAGDFCPQERIKEKLQNNCYDDIVTDEIKEIIRLSDYSILNFETTVNTTGLKTIEKAGPCLSTSPEAIEAVKQAGFHCVTLANNHFRDFGNESCIETLSYLDNVGIDYVGGGANISEAAKTLFKTVNGINIAIINACEHEFSIASGDSAGSAPLDVIDVTTTIQSAKAKSDFVIVIVHGGHEYYQLPSPRMKKLYRFFISQGADVVVNHHQHCYSGYEVFNGKQIFYGLGNFCFDGNRSGGKDMWYEGYMVSLELSKGDESRCVTFELHPYIQCKEEPVVREMTELERNSFNKKIDVFNEIIQNDDSLNASFNEWCKKKSAEMQLLLTPYSHRLFTGLWRRGLLPSFLPKKRILSLINKIDCEAHRDVLIHLLKSRL